jgi:hypothetical protein
MLQSLRKFVFGMLRGPNLFDQTGLFIDTQVAWLTGHDSHEGGISHCGKPESLIYREARQNLSHSSPPQVQDAGQNTCFRRILLRYDLWPMDCHHSRRTYRCLAQPNCHAAHTSSHRMLRGCLKCICNLRCPVHLPACPTRLVLHVQGDLHHI